MPLYHNCIANFQNMYHAQIYLFNNIKLDIFDDNIIDEDHLTYRTPLQIKTNIY